MQVAPLLVRQPIGTLPLAAVLPGALRVALAAPVLFAVFTLRGSKLRAVSVRYMHEREVASYEEGLAQIDDR